MPDHSLISAKAKPPELQAFREGQEVKVLCPMFDCAEVEMPAILGKEQPTVRICFQNERKIGRFPWQPGAPMIAFLLEKSVICPRCQACYRTVVIACLETQTQPLLCAA